MKIYYSTILAISLMPLSIGLANAEDAIYVLGDVQVIATDDGALHVNEVLSSVDILTGERVQGQSVYRSWELLGQMPGTQLTEWRQGAESGKPSFRAFNGEGELNAVKLLIDGVPSNVNSGNMRYMDMVFPLELEAIEAVRGTNDPRYGLYGIAGNINLVTRLGGDYTDAKLIIGDFKTRTLQLAKGIQSGDFSQNYFVAQQTYAGYRTHSDSDTYSFSGKWFVSPANGNYRVGLIARKYEQKADEAGYLTAQERMDDPTQSAVRNSTDRDARNMKQVAGFIDVALPDNFYLATKLYANDINDLRFVTFAPGNQQTERLTIEAHTGMLASVTWKPKMDGLHKLSIEIGVNQEHQDNQYMRYRALNGETWFAYGAGGTAYIRNDQSFTLDNSGSYIQAVIKPTEQLQIVPAYRWDLFDGNYTNRANLSLPTYRLNDYGLIRQPKLSAIYSPTSSYSVYGNWGRSFQIGVGGNAPAYIVNQADIAPSMNTGWEVGMKFKPTDWSNGRMAVWQQTAASEMARFVSVDQYDHVGKTRRQGADLQFQLQPMPLTNFWISCSVQEAKILESTNVAYAGKYLDHVPDYLFSAGIDHQSSGPWRLGLTARAQGSYYLERTNVATGKFGGFVLFDAYANYQMTEKLSIDLQVKNLADRYSEYVWYDAATYAGTLHAPNNGRSFMVALTMKL